MSGAPFISLFGLRGPAGAAGASGAGLYPTSSGIPGYAVARRYWVNGAIAYTNIGPAIDTLFAIPVLLGRAVTVDELAFQVTVVAAAGGVGRVGLYSNVAGGMYPNALLAGSNDIATDGATGFKSLTGLAVVIAANTVVWYALSLGVASPTVRGPSGFNLAQQLLGQAQNTVLGPPSGIAVARAHAALPANFPAGANETVAVSWPIAMLRFSAIA